MADNRFIIFQCENPGCGLRFPGEEGHPRWNRCPICRSKITPIRFIDTTDHSNKRILKPVTILIEVLLDNIRSAMNVGSIFRTADGLGISKIYCCGITPNPDNPKVTKTALDAENIIPWISSPNGLLTAIDLKKQGHILWALEDIPRAESLFEIELPKVNSPLTIIMGNELTGIDPDIIDLCDKVISIPMVGKKQSYNVGIAFGITASFLLYRQWSISSG